MKTKVKTQAERRYNGFIGSVMVFVLAVFWFFLDYVKVNIVEDQLINAAEQGIVAQLNSDQKSLKYDESASTQAIVETSAEKSISVIWHKGGAIDMEVKNIIKDAPQEAVLEKNFLEYNLIIPLSELKGDYYGVITYPTRVFSKINQQFNLLYWVVVLVVCLVFILSRRFLRDKILLPLNEIESSLKHFMKSDYSEITVAGKDGVIGELADTVNEFQADFQNHRQQVDANEERLSLLLDNLNLGVVMLSSEGELVLYNPAAQELLGLDDSAYGQVYRAAIKSYILVNMIEYAYETKQGASDEIEFYIPDTRYIDVNIVPLMSQNGENIQSMLVLLYDVTQVHRLETVRTEFVANASHELRTPVTSIKGFSETLLNGALEEPEVAEHFVKIINSESDRLEKIVNDILELSKVEKKTAKVKMKEFNLKNALDDLVSSYKRKAKKQKIEIKVDVPKELNIYSDRHRIEQIVANLVDNALNYAGPNSQVLIQAEELNDGVRITVQDNGRGIPEYDQERIFERFYRVDKDRSRNSGGTGLGLSIVRNLVSYLGGEIELTSSLGEGTCFDVMLPNKN